MIRLSKYLIPVLSAILSGCIGIIDRTGNKSEISYLYQPTCEDAEMISIPFKDGSKMSSEGRIAKAYCTVLLPVSIVDLPFEIVFDTVLIPWDLCVISSNKKGQKE